MLPNRSLEVATLVEEMLDVIENYESDEIHVNPVGRDVKHFTMMCAGDDTDRSFKPFDTKNHENIRRIGITMTQAQKKNQGDILASQVESDTVQSNCGSQSASAEESLVLKLSPFLKGLPIEIHQEVNFDSINTSVQISESSDDQLPNTTTEESNADEFCLGDRNASQEILLQGDEGSTDQIQVEVIMKSLVETVAQGMDESTDLKISFQPDAFHYTVDTTSDIMQAISENDSIRSAEETAELTTSNADEDMKCSSLHIENIILSDKGNGSEEMCPEGENASVANFGKHSTVSQESETHDKSESNRASQNKITKGDGFDESGKMTRPLQQMENEDCHGTRSIEDFTAGMMREGSQGPEQDDLHGECSGSAKLGFKDLDPVVEQQPQKVDDPRDTSAIQTVQTDIKHVNPVIRMEIYDTPDVSGSPPAAESDQDMFEDGEDIKDTIDMIVEEVDSILKEGKCDIVDVELVAGIDISAIQDQDTEESDDHVECMEAIQTPGEVTPAFPDTQTFPEAMIVKDVPGTDMEDHHQKALEIVMEILQDLLTTCLTFSEVEKHLDEDLSSEIPDEVEHLKEDLPSEIQIEECLDCDLSSKVLDEVENCLDDDLSCEIPDEIQKELANEDLPSDIQDEVEECLDEDLSSVIPDEIEECLDDDLPSEIPDVSNGNEQVSMTPCEFITQKAYSKESTEVNTAEADKEEKTAEIPEPKPEQSSQDIPTQTFADEDRGSETTVSHEPIQAQDDFGETRDFDTPAVILSGSSDAKKTVIPSQETKVADPTEDDSAILMKMTCVENSPTSEQSGKNFFVLDSGNGIDSSKELNEEDFQIKQDTKKNLGTSEVQCVPDCSIDYEAEQPEVEPTGDSDVPKTDETIDSDVVFTKDKPTVKETDSLLMTANKSCLTNSSRNDDDVSDEVSLYEANGEGDLAPEDGGDLVKSACPGVQTKSTDLIKHRIEEPSEEEILFQDQCVSFADPLTEYHEYSQISLDYASQSTLDIADLLNGDLDEAYDVDAELQLIFEGKMDCEVSQTRDISCDVLSGPNACLDEERSLELPRNNFVEKDILPNKSCNELKFTELNKTQDYGFNISDNFLQFLDKGCEDSLYHSEGFNDGKRQAELAMDEVTPKRSKTEIWVENARAHAEEELRKSQEVPDDHIIQEVEDCDDQAVPSMVEEELPAGGLTKACSGGYGHFASGASSWQYPVEKVAYLPQGDQTAGASEIPSIPPLQTCAKPVRIGLSRRQRVPRLHPYLRASNI